MPLKGFFLVRRIFGGWAEGGSVAMSGEASRTLGGFSGRLDLSPCCCGLANSILAQRPTMFAFVRSPHILSGIFFCPQMARSVCTAPSRVPSRPTPLIRCNIVRGFRVSGRRKILNFLNFELSSSKSGRVAFVTVLRMAFRKLCFRREQWEQGNKLYQTGRKPCIGGGLSCSQAIGQFWEHGNRNGRP